MLCVLLPLALHLSTDTRPRTVDSVAPTAKQSAAIHAESPVSSITPGDELRDAVKSTASVAQTPASANYTLSRPVPAPPAVGAPDKGKQLMNFLTGKGHSKRRGTPHRDSTSRLSIPLSKPLEPLPLPPRLQVGNSWSTVGTNFGNSYADGLSTLKDLSKQVATSCASNVTENREVKSLLQHIARWNAHGPVLNYQPTATGGTDTDNNTQFEFVVAVMASNRPAYLGLLLEVLDRTPHPASLLVIISHDGLDGSTLDAVSTMVDNVRVKQLVFPLARSLLCDNFPARGTRDCHEDAVRAHGAAPKCRGDVDT